MVKVVQTRVQDRDDLTPQVVRQACVPLRAGMH